MWFSSNSSDNKIEIVEFPNGKFAIRKNGKFYSCSSQRWIEPGSVLMKYCVIDTLAEAQVLAGVCKVVN